MKLDLTDGRPLDRRRVNHERSVDPDSYERMEAVTRHRLTRASLDLMFLDRNDLLRAERYHIRNS